MKKSSTWLILEGDWGGQIYLTVPSHLVGDWARVDELLEKLDTHAWDCNEGLGRSGFLYDPSEDGHTSEDGFPGGMGGGQLEDRLWLHEEFQDGPWAELARQLLLLTDESCPAAAKTAPRDVPPE